MVKNDMEFPFAQGTLSLNCSERNWCTLTLDMANSPSVRLGSDSVKIVLTKLARMLDPSISKAGAQSQADFAFFIALYEDHWSGYAKHEPNKVLVEWRSDGARHRVSFQLTEAERLDWLTRIKALGVTSA